MKVIVIVTIFLFSAYTNGATANSCGYSSCPLTNSSMINVHIVPHTHDDVGWLKTVQQYFWGTRNNVTHVSVKNIIDSVIKELHKDQSRRFMYVESAFFWIWWKQASPKSRELFRSLVNNGQMEIVSGGWSMNDEACVHYQSTIDQMTWGHRRLFDTLGNCSIPRIGWQIDPFGHSREQAFINTQMAFDALFFARAHYLDKTNRKKNHRMQFLWRASDDVPDTDLFTGILSDDYGPPSHFNFDSRSGEDSIVDDPNSEEYNIDRLTEEMIKDAEERASLYKSSNIMLTFGQDFNYQDATVNFENMDKLIAAVNERQRGGSKVNLLYSTPSCYVYNLNREGKSYSTKKDDFFPYASDPHAFWTGYFTSRPAFKLYERQSNLLLQSCKSLQVFAGLTSQEYDEAVAVMKEAMGIAQHHDAVSGTEKEHVARDYALQLNKGRLSCLPIVTKALNDLLPSTNFYKIHHCPLLNVSACPITETEASFTVIVHNLLAWSRPGHLITIPWTDEGARVTGPDGKELQVDIVPIPASVQSLPDREDSIATTELTIKLDVPASSISALTVERTDTKFDEPTVSRISSRGLLLKSKSMEVSFDSTGQIQFVKLSNGNKIKLQQDFLVYRSMNGNNSAFAYRASGAYIFRPNGTAEPIKDSHNDQPSAKYTQGKFFTQVERQINPWISQTIRVNSDDDLIQFDYRVGPIDLSDKVGKEVISRFTTDLNNNGTFYTDSNGRQLMKRIRNNWVTFDYEDSEPVAGNYYPVNTKIIMRDVDKNVQMTVFTDRTQGGTSLQDGQVELMVHRRILHDDDFGVEEALNEPGFDHKGLIIRGTHSVFISSIEDASQHRQLAIRLHLPPVLYFSPASTIVSDQQKHFNAEAMRILTHTLPPSIHLLTVENWRNGDTLVRLEHIYQSSDPKSLKKLVTIDLVELFKTYKRVVSVIDLTLSANEQLKQVNRLDWKKEKEERIKLSRPIRSDPPCPGCITLLPMTIRTVLIKWEQSDVSYVFG